jgi:hypothetical protein
MGVIDRTNCFPEPRLVYYKSYVWGGVKRNCRAWQMYFNRMHDPHDNFKKIYAWCWATFGHPGTDPETGVTSDWDYHDSWIYFYDEKYVTMYILRWL